MLAAERRQTEARNAEVNSESLVGVFMMILDDLIDSLGGRGFTVAGSILRMPEILEEM